MTEKKTGAAGVRIQKAISDAGVASRRKAEELIEQGLVTVNGRRAVIGQKVNPKRDLIAVDGQKIDPREQSKKIYVALHKPRGFVTTMSDELGRRCVAELVADTPARVYPIGRLDRNSEGLLLLTNDGEFANTIMHPRYHVNKVYRVTVRPDVTDDQVMRLAEGVRLDDGFVTSPAQVLVISKEAGRVVMQITISEGKNRQVRRMCEAVGLEVARLKRIAVGPVRLGMLQPGQWRMLTAQELSALKSIIAPAGEGRAKRGGKR
ncbi:MAG: rRNA pseudouridine synthase [Oscillospiraceae bacterium]|nr:rRNA pseudouridine synthase [Oscillospiraceae bacterium]